MAIWMWILLWGACGILPAIYWVYTAYHAYEYVPITNLNAIITFVGNILPGPLSFILMLLHIWFKHTWPNIWKWLNTPFLGKKPRN